MTEEFPSIPAQVLAKPGAAAEKATAVEAAAKAEAALKATALAPEAESFEVEVPAPVPAVATAPFSAPTPETELKLQALRSELESYQRALRDVRDESAMIARFEKEAALLKDPRQVAHRLAKVSAQLCQSPTLVFLYEERVHSAILAADSGLSTAQAPVAMSFPVDESVLIHLSHEFPKGEVVSLATYPPLQRAMMARLGVAHFEAWALAGYGPLGRQSGRPRLLGVLVVIQSGVDSFTRHEQLGRMIRATGLVYENALLSR